jgi:hypothetical protein
MHVAVRQGKHVWEDVSRMSYCFLKFPCPYHRTPSKQVGEVPSIKGTKEATETSKEAEEDGGENASRRDSMKIKV